MISVLQKSKHYLIVFIVTLFFFFPTNALSEQRKGIGINLNNFLKEINTVGEDTGITLNRMFMLPFNYNKDSTAIKKEFYGDVTLKIISHKADEQVYLLIIEMNYNPKIFENKQEYDNRMVNLTETFMAVVFTMVRAANADTLTRIELLSLYRDKIDFDDVFVNGGPNEYSTRFLKYSFENDAKNRTFIFKIEGVLSI